MRRCMTPDDFYSTPVGDGYEGGIWDAGQKVFDVRVEKRGDESGATDVYLYHPDTVELRGKWVADLDANIWRLRAHAGLRAACHLEAFIRDERLYTHKNMLDQVFGFRSSLPKKPLWDPSGKGLIVVAEVGGAPDDPYRIIFRQCAFPTLTPALVVSVYPPANGEPSAIALDSRHCKTLRDCQEAVENYITVAENDHKFIYTTPTEVAFPQV